MGYVVARNENLSKVMAWDSVPVILR